MEVLTMEGVECLVENTKNYVSENKTDFLQASFEVTDGNLIMTIPDDADEPDMHIDENGYLVYTPN